LNVADLDMQNHLVKVKTEKSKGVRPFRVLPYDIFDQQAVEALPMWLEKRNELLQNLQLEEADTLFFGVRTTKARGRRLAINAIGEIFAKYSNRAGMTVEEYVNAHSLRHHYGNELTRRHFNNSVISEAMGHSQISSSYRYTQLESGDLTETLRGKVLS
jgi:site-specific recombinase XerD